MTNAARLQIVVEADVSKAESGLQSLGQKVQSFGQSFTQGLGIGAGIAAFEAGAAVNGRQLGALKGSVIDFNQQMDQSRAVFTRYFEGNTQLADQFLRTLNGFAARTPFESKDLTELAVRLQNANTNANDIIPTIQAIGNAASASGSLSKESLDRITLALTQMQMKGKVTGEEMLQLTEAGVPAWQLLADATGKPIPVLQEMASKGEITADVFNKAFRGMYENAGLMEGASKSLEGALSTIRDVGTQAFADIGRSVYELATQGANQLATFLSSEQFQVWVQAGKVAVDGMIAGIKSLLESLAPVGQAFSTAFHQLTEGDFSGAFSTLGGGIQMALDMALDRVRTFGQQMFGGGVTLIQELAGGLVAGAQGALQGALDAVTSLIANVLIGNSPPPAGPLTAIKQGGANTIAAWGEGAAAAADEAVKPVVDKIAGGLDGLKDAGKGADAAIREIGRSIADLDSQTSDLKFKIDDIKDGYKDQLDPLEQQLKSITQRTDYEAEEQQLLFQMEESSLKRAENEAQGSREVRARLDDQIEELNLQKQAIQNAAKREELDRKARGERSAAEDRLESLRDAGKGRDEDPEVRRLQDRLDSLRDGGSSTRPKSAAEKALEALRNNRTGSTANSGLDDEKEALRVQEARLKLNERANDIAQKMAKGEDVGFAQDQLRLDQQQLELSIKEYAAKKAAAAEEVKRQQEIAKLEETVRKEKEAADRAEQARKKEIADAEKALAAAKKKDQDEERARQKEIADLERTVRDEKRQAQMAEAGRQRELAGIDRQILDLNQQKADLVDKPKLAAIKDAQAELAERKNVFETAQKEDKLRRDMLALPIRQEIARIKDEQEATLKPLGEQLDQLTRQKSELSEQRQQWQSVKQEIAAATAELKEQDKAAKEAAKNTPTKPVNKAFTPDVDAEGAAAKAKEAGQKLAERLGEGFQGWWADNKGKVVASVIGAIAGGLIGGPIGAVAGAAFLPSFVDKLKEKLNERGFDAQPFIDAFSESLQTSDWGKPAEMLAYGMVRASLRLPREVFRAVSQVVVDAIMPDETQTSKATSTLIGGLLRGLLGGLRDGVGDFARGMLNFLIPIDFVEQLGRRFREIAIEKSLQAIVQQMRESGQEVGEETIEGIRQGITERVDRITDAIKDGFGIVSYLKKLFGIASPSTVMAEIGDELVAGLLAGVQARLKDFTDWWGALPSKIYGAFGWTGSALSWVADLQAIGSKILEGMRDGIQAFWDQPLKPWLEGAGSWVYNAVVAYGGGPLNWLVEVGKNALQGLKDGVQAFWDQPMSPWLQGAGDWVIKAFRTFGGGPLGWLVDSGKDALQGVKDGVQGFWDEKLKPWLNGAGSWVIDAFTTYAGGPINWLVDTGSKILEGLKDGLFRWLRGDQESVLAKWIRENLTDRLPDWVKHALGINSPSTVFQGIGQSLIDGLLLGMRDRFPQISSFIGSLNATLGGVGGSVDIDAVLRRAIQVTGVPEGWFDGLRWIVEHEDPSGDPAAKNPDSTATGLFQLIDTTWADLARRFGLTDIKDPLQNAVAGIRYITERYGTPDNAVAFWKANNYYDKGGRLREDIFGFGPSGQTYMLHRGEGVIPPDVAGMLAPVQPPRDWMPAQASSGGDTYLIDLRGAQVYDGSRFEDLLVGALDRANRHQRIIKVTR